MWAQAVAFNDTSVIAGADSDPGGTALPAGGRGSIALTLTERTGGQVGPDTRTTDIKTVAPDMAVNTTAPAHFSAVAVCDVDGDGTQDLVLGAPETEYLIGPVGAVYVVFGTQRTGERDRSRQSHHADGVPLLRGKTRAISWAPRSHAPT